MKDIFMGAIIGAVLMGLITILHVVKEMNENINGRFNQIRQEIMLLKSK